MTKNSEHALIWFGAGVSIAEILTGTYYASLGLKNGAYAILLGHLIGFIFMYLAGYISERSGKSSMEKRWNIIRDLKRHSTCRMDSNHDLRRSTIC